MVTAGVYLVIRSHVLFELSGVALTVVLVVGLATAFFAATCAIAQFDIKRVLAYSTISQLGYMFIAVGMRAYAVAMFFLVAHAFYKALMFLGAGFGDPRDARRAGHAADGGPAHGDADHLRRRSRSAGSRRRACRRSPGSSRRTRCSRSPTTRAARPSIVIVTITAFLTAFYIGRMLILTFFGRPRSERAEHAHESPSVMWLPLAILARRRRSWSGSLETSPEGRLATALEPVVGALPQGGGLVVRGARRDRRGGRRCVALAAQLVDLRVGPGRPGGVPRAPRAVGDRRPARLVRRPRLRHRVRPARQGVRASRRRRGRRAR